MKYFLMREEAFSHLTELVHRGEESSQLEALLGGIFGHFIQFKYDVPLVEDFLILLECIFQTTYKGF